MVFHDGLLIGEIIYFKFEHVTIVSDNTLHLDYIRIWLLNLSFDATVGKTWNNAEANSFSSL